MQSLLLSKTEDLSAAAVLHFVALLLLLSCLSVLCWPLMRSDDNGKDGRGMLRPLPLHQLRQANEASHRLSVSEVRPSDMIVVTERSLWCGECGRSRRPVLALACSRRAFQVDQRMAGDGGSQIKGRSTDEARERKGPLQTTPLRR